MTTFDERAREWDTPERIARAEAIAEAIGASVRLAPTMRAIEIGAGTGLLGLAVDAGIDGGFAELVVTDPSTGMLEVAEEKIRRRGLGSVRTARYDLMVDEPPAPGRFDLVLSLLMLHHVEDTDAVFRTAASLLVPGGHLAMADLDTEDGSFHDADAEGIHHRGFDRDRLRSLASAAGFDRIAVRTAGEIERDGRRYPLFLLTARVPG